MESFNSSKKVIKRGMAGIDIREFISAFAVLVAACIIPYAVRIVDLVVLILAGIGSQDKRGSYTFGEILTQDYNQPMNLAYVMVANYLLYIIVFGLWYRHWKKKHDIDAITETGEQSDIHGSGLRYQLGILGHRLLKLFKTPVPYLLIIAGFAGQVMVDSVLNILRDIFPDTFAEYDALVSSTVGATSSVAMLIAVYILAPIGEEFLFRGLLQGKLAKAVNGSPMPVVILLQGILFGVYHGNLIQGIYAFLLGSLLGLIAYKADSLLPCMVFHMALNASVSLVSENWFDETISCVIAGAISLVVFVPCVILTLRVITKNNHNKTENKNI
jgi:hypothetical protein